MNFSQISNSTNYKNNNLGTFNNIESDLFTFDKIQENKHIKKNNLEAALKGDFYKACDSEINIDETAKIFFSSENMRRIQKMIKREIYNKTKGVFRLDTNQDESDLLVAMRAVYYEHANFLPFKIIKQVKELNRKLLEYIIPDVITQIKQSYAYIQEINQPIKPIARPINVNNAGRRTLPGLTTAWGI